MRVLNKIKNQKMDRLISMIDYVAHLRGMTTSEICKAYPKYFNRITWKGSIEQAVNEITIHDAIKWMMVGEYMKFLMTKTCLSMFVPCYMEDGIYIPYTSKTPLNTVEKFNEFELAKKRVLFRGFEAVLIPSHYDYDIMISHFQLNIAYRNNENKKWLISRKYSTIQDLIPYNLILNDNEKY